MNQVKFERYIDYSIRIQSPKLFNDLCNKYPNAIDFYVRRIENEVKNVDISWFTSEREKKVWNNICKKIQEYEEKRK